MCTTKNISYTSEESSTVIKKKRRPSPRSPRRGASGKHLPVQGAEGAAKALSLRERRPLRSLCRVASRRRHLHLNASAEKAKTIL